MSTSAEWTSRTNGLQLWGPDGRKWKRSRRMRQKEVERYLRRPEVLVGLVEHWGTPNGIEWLEGQERHSQWLEKVNPGYVETPNQSMAPPSPVGHQDIAYSATLWRNGLDEKLVLLEWHCA